MGFIDEKHVGSCFLSMNRDSLFVFRFWERVVIRLDRSSFLQRLDLKGLRLGFPMDACSLSPFVPLVAFFLRNKQPE